MVKRIKPHLQMTKFDSLAVGILTPLACLVLVDIYIEREREIPITEARVISLLCSLEFLALELYAMGS